MSVNQFSSFANDNMMSTKVDAATPSLAGVFTSGGQNQPRGMQWARSMMCPGFERNPKDTGHVVPAPVQTNLNNDKGVYFLRKGQ